MADLPLVKWTVYKIHRRLQFTYCFLNSQCRQTSARMVRPTLRHQLRHLLNTLLINKQFVVSTFIHNYFPIQPPFEIKELQEISHPHSRLRPRSAVKSFYNLCLSKSVGVVYVEILDYLTALTSSLFHLFGINGRLFSVNTTILTSSKEGSPGSISK